MEEVETNNSTNCTAFTAKTTLLEVLKNNGQFGRIFESQLTKSMRGKIETAIEDLRRADHKCPKVVLFNRLLYLFSDNLPFSIDLRTFEHKLHGKKGIVFPDELIGDIKWHETNYLSCPVDLRGVKNFIGDIVFPRRARSIILNEMSESIQLPTEEIERLQIAYPQNFSGSALSCSVKSLFLGNELQWSILDHLNIPRVTKGLTFINVNFKNITNNNVEVTVPNDY